MKSPMLPVCSNPVGKEQKAEDGGQMAEDGGRRTDGRRRRTEDRWQKTDDGRVMGEKADFGFLGIAGVSGDF
jgi:hypothetical protein